MIGIDHGIVQATIARHHRYAAISQRIKLGEAARLEARRNDDGVTTGLHEVRERLVIADRHADPVRMTGGRCHQRAFQTDFARAQHYEATAHGHDIIGNLGDQVDALLPGEAGDDAEKWAVIVVHPEVAWPPLPC